MQFHSVMYIHPLLIMSDESDLLRRPTAGSIIEDSGFKFT